jgi:hypothetical protein
MYLLVDIPNLQPLSTRILIFICDVHYSYAALQIMPMHGALEIKLRRQKRQKVKTLVFDLENKNEDQNLSRRRPKAVTR